MLKCLGVKCPAESQICLAALTSFVGDTPLRRADEFEPLTLGGNGGLADFKRVGDRLNELFPEVRSTLTIMFQIRTTPELS